jgi:CRP/FNR family transcriptional regulator, cyclic AMP receptor protein
MEDVLAHLPIAGITEYSQGRTIYSPACPSNSLYLVISGKVVISQIALDQKEVVLEIIRPEELFGETAFLGDPRHSEQAVALEGVSVMSWSINRVEAMVTKRPRLALALLQIMAQRNADHRRRIESFSRETMDCRLAGILIRFTERLGKLDKNGIVTLMPLTHDLLARCVGTSREIITQHMNRFRKQGYLSYSRHGIVLTGNALKMAFGQNSASRSGATATGTLKRYVADELALPDMQRTQVTGN